MTLKLKYLKILYFNYMNQEYYDLDYDETENRLLTI